MGCPIRRSMDQSSFAAPHGFSQRITSFFACACQGIHQMPLRHLIVLIANAHHLASQRDAAPATFNNRNIHNAIDASDPVLIEATPSSFKAGSQDQLLEITSGDARSGNINPASGQRQLASPTTRYLSDRASYHSKGLPHPGSTKS